jgi:exonuclease III
VLGGDWNTTWDNSPPDTNIDIINMVRAPNAANGFCLNNMANEFDLLDPFRTLYPNKIAFSYSPFGSQRKNKSRLDFFVISSTLISKVTACNIYTAQLSAMFDHKPVALHFSDSKKKVFTERKKIITNWYLDDPLIKMSSELAALQIYSAVIDEGQHNEI